MSNFFKFLAVLTVVIGTIALYFILVLWPQPKERKFLEQSDASNPPISAAPLQIGGQFNLVDIDGNHFSSEQLLGKPYLIYFGFTFCPDVCPASLSKISKVMENLEKYHLNIKALFVTIDPNRDTPEVLKEYVKNFNSNIIPLTGSSEELKDITEKFKVYYAVVPLENSKTSNDYNIDHSVYVYFMNEEGKYEKHFDLNSSELEITNYIVNHLRKTRRK